MIDGKRVLAVIPARGGSKGVARKNLRRVAGKPLLAYSIEAARASRYLDCVAVSSEDEEILAAAAAFGAKLIHRPPHLAADETPGIAPVLHAIENCPGFDYVVLLQPTSPLRSTADIDQALEYCLAQAAPVCVSVCEAAVSPFRTFRLEAGKRLVRLLPVADAGRRQDLPPAYTPNGAVYVANTSWLAREQRFIGAQTVAFVMPPERSLDVDTELDLDYFAFLLARGGKAAGVGA
jgi:CMP-N,N'-diacetyllegionaminic acid synthase